MRCFRGWDLRSARIHLVLLSLLLLGGEWARWAARDRLPPLGPDGEYLPAPAFAGGASGMSEREKWVRGIPMDIARVGERELELLPGVGPVLAKAIAGWIRQNGPPRDLGALAGVKGVGPGLLGVLREHLRAEGAIDTPLPSR